MSLSLPAPIASYFRAETSDGDALAQCFTEDGILDDEGRIYRGRQAIKEWREIVWMRSPYTSEPISCEFNGEKYIVITRLSGNFPRSPLDFKFAFRISEERIALLEMLL